MCGTLPCMTTHAPTLMSLNPLSLPAGRPRGRMHLLLSTHPHGIMHCDPCQHSTVTVNLLRFDVLSAATSDENALVCQSVTHHQHVESCAMHSSMLMHVHWLLTGRSPARSTRKIFILQHHAVHMHPDPCSEQQHWLLRSMLVYTKLQPQQQHSC